jgi:RsmE family RNA methyltransferase
MAGRSISGGKIIMNLIILTDNDSIDERTYRLTDHRAEHVRNILKSEIGESIEVGILNGPKGVAEITKISGNEILLACEFPIKEKQKRKPVIDLICALPRPQTLKKVLITSATMGVNHLHLIRANRVEKSYFHSPLLEPENYTPFLIEGLSQGKLTELPEVSIHHRFKPFFEDTLPNIEKTISESYMKIFPEPGSQSRLDNIYKQDFQHLFIAVGPEGGWIPFEIELMESMGFIRFTLGHWILRVESAVTAVLSQIELVKMMHDQ